MIDLVLNKWFIIVIYTDYVMGERGLKECRNHVWGIFICTKQMILELMATYRWEDESLLRVVLKKQSTQFKVRNQHLQLMNHSTKLINQAFHKE